MDHKALKPFFAYFPSLNIKKSFDFFSHYMRMPLSRYLRQHHCSPNSAANFYGRNEINCTNNVFSDTPAVENGATAAQL